MFSQNLPTLDLIEVVLNSPHWGDLIEIPSTTKCLFKTWRRDVDYLRIDGSITDRQVLIDKYNREGSREKVFLISTKAGNMGINLQAANRVVIFDSSFNPVEDLQAIYRSYRYGQKKEVFVYRLLSRGSLEEKIYRRAVIKMQLFMRVVDGKY